MQILIPVLFVAAIGLIAGVGLSLASKFMEVPSDERVEQIRAALPGANCGACGYSGCDGYAAAIADGSTQPNKCAPGGETCAAALAEILGVAVENEQKVAFIACGGNRAVSALKYQYDGMQSCAAASLVQGGPLECSYGCIGFGDCYRACPFDAITMEDDRPNICASLCVGCGKCVTACPKGIISLRKPEEQVRVVCSNKEKGAHVVKACKVACVACMMCEKACPTGAIKVVDNLAQIDYDLCTACGKCIEVCKFGAIAKF